MPTKDSRDIVFIDVVLQFSSSQNEYTIFRRWKKMQLDRMGPEVFEATSCMILGAVQTNSF
ncbi:hypothetical protein XA39_15455 [Acinetobacter tandoii]|nr:hypothetical protein XA39_15455 [Acinetobacter tandoii]